MSFLKTDKPPPLSIVAPPTIPKKNKYNMPSWLKHPPFEYSGACSDTGLYRINECYSSQLHDLIQKTLRDKIEKWDERSEQWIKDIQAKRQEVENASGDEAKELKAVQELMSSAFIKDQIEYVEDLRSTKKNIAMEKFDEYFELLLEWYYAIKTCCSGSFYDDENRKGFNTCTVLGKKLDDKIKPAHFEQWFPEFNRHALPNTRQGNLKLPCDDDDNNYDESSSDESVQTYYTSEKTLNQRKKAAQQREDEYEKEQLMKNREQKEIYSDEEELIDEDEYYDDSDYDSEYESKPSKK